MYISFKGGQNPIKERKTDWLKSQLTISKKNKKDEILSKIMLSEVVSKPNLETYYLHIRVLKKEGIHTHAYY